MNRTLLPFLLTLISAPVVAPIWGQDMPLSQVLIEGEGWHVVAQGHAFTDAASSDAEGNFYFTDVQQGTTINKITPDGTVSVFAKNAPKVSGMQFGPDGRIYACQVGDLGRVVSFDRNGQMQIVADNLKPNDLVVTASGAIYLTETGKQQVTLIPPGGKPVSVDVGVARPNGICLSPDQGTLAVSDYGGENVWVWRIETDGKLSFKTPYMTMRTPAPNLPSKGDGMVTDSDGRYYVTSAMGIQMFDPTGRMGGVIAPPQNKPLVSIEFAGPDLSYMYVACGDKIYRRKTKTRGVLYFQPPKLKAGSR